MIAPIFYKLSKPLPPHYQFYFITYHAIGHNAMMDFLKYCGVSINGDCQEISSLERYKKNYETLSRFHTHCPLALCEYNFKDFYQYTHLLNARVPALLLVRDPISVLKSCINFVATPKEKTINEGGQNKLLNICNIVLTILKPKNFILLTLLALTT